MWSLGEALTLIRDLQPKLHSRKYHVALGGGVLNKGQSDKDLDLYVFPFDAQSIPAILPYLETLWGPCEQFLEKDLVPGPGRTMADYPPDANFEVKGKFITGGRRIDIFITKNGIA